MRITIPRAALALLPAVMAGAAASAVPTPVPSAPAPAPPPVSRTPDAPAPAARAGEAEVAASFRAISDADINRLIRDRAYAAEMLVHLERVAPAMIRTNRPGWIRDVRIVTYATLGRSAEVKPLIDEIIAERPTEARAYAVAWFGALILHDTRRAINIVETAGRALPAVRRADLRALLNRQSVTVLLSRLSKDDARTERVRFAQALFRIGWPGDGDTESSDYIRSILLDGRLAAGDADAARGYAAGITSLGNVLPLLVGRRYDIALPADADADRGALLAEAIAREDRESRAALAAAPGDMRLVVARAQLLGGLARDGEALDLLRPHLADLRATLANGEFGMWVVDAAVSALAALNRYDEAIQIMDRVAALPLAENPRLIGVRINHLPLLLEAGRNEEVLRRATALAPEAATLANDVGRMWIAASRVCALAALDRNAEAAPQITYMRGLGEINPAALTQAYLCLGDEDAAAALLVHRLEAADPGPAILALQDYTRGEVRGPALRLQVRLNALRERPEVRAAFDRVGRRLALPLARGYYGTY